MSDPAFGVVREGEERRALDVLVTAFTADPVIRWLYPDASGYLTHFPAFLRAFGGMAFTSQTVWRLGEFEAVALWFPPHVEPDGDAVIAVERMLDDGSVERTRTTDPIPRRVRRCSSRRRRRSC